MALPEIQVEPRQTDTTAAVNGRWAGYRALLGARMKELWREPEVIFWVFVFPLLLALGLGIAFRNKPADITPIAVFTPMCSMRRRRSTASDWASIPS